MNFKTVLVVSIVTVLVLTIGCGKDEKKEVAAPPPSSLPTSFPPLQSNNLAGTTPLNEPIPDIVARVGDAVITRQDYQRQLEYALNVLEQRGQPRMMTDQQRALLLDAIINEKIFYLYALRNGVTVSEEKVKEDLEHRKRSLPSEEAFQQWLASQGMTLDDLLAMRREQMISLKATKEMTKDLVVTEEELKEMHESLKAAGKMNRPSETVDVAHILTETKEAAEAARQRILAGESFADVAKEVSTDPTSAEDGGLYPETPRGAMVPEFEEKMFNIPIGEISEPFKTNFGWHILTVYAKHEMGEMNFDSVKGNIKDFIMKKKQGEAIQQIAQEERAKMNVEIFYLKDLIENQPTPATASAPAPAEAPAVLPAPAPAPAEIPAATPAPAPAPAEAPAATPAPAPAGGQS